MAVTLPDTAATGDAGHVTDHNLIVAAVTQVDAVLDGWLSNRSGAYVDTLPRQLLLNTGGGTGTGTVYWTFFTASKTVTATKIAMASGSTASASLTVARMGVCTIDQSDVSAAIPVLVCRTASDTTLFNSAGTVYERSFDTTGGYAANITLTAGVRYGITVIQVGTTTATLAGTGTGHAGVGALLPQTAGATGSQADLVNGIGPSFTTHRPMWARLSA